jgi:DNA-directed RNA polymerase specialized sigma24 family protein
VTPLAIVAALQGGTHTPATWGALEALVRQRVGRVVRPPQDRDDAVQDVLYKFAEKALRGELRITGRSDEEVAAYISTMARNGWHSAGRKAKRAPTPDDDAVAAAAEPSTADDDLDREREGGRAAALFGRVAEAAVERTPAANRDARRLAWRQVEELYFDDDLTVDDLVARDEGLAPDAPRVELTRAANRAMKQHQRFREAVLLAADALAVQGELSPDERSLVGRMVLELKRR